MKKRTTTYREQFAKLTPGQRLRSMRAWEGLQDGSIKPPPLRCGGCKSPSIETVVEAQSVLLYNSRESYRNERLYHCVTCGRWTRPSDAEEARREEIQSIILRGVDLVEK